MTEGEETDTSVQVEYDSWQDHLKAGYEQLEAHNLEKGYDLLAKAIDLMSQEEYTEKRPELVSNIASAICGITIDDESDNGDSFLLLYNSISKDGDQEACFGIAIAEKVQESVKDILPENIPWVYMAYCEILVSTIASTLDPAVMNYAALSCHLFFNGGFKQNYRIVAYENNIDIIDGTNFFFDRISERLDEKIAATPEEEIDKIIDFWAESNNPSYLAHLFSAQVESLELCNAKGMLAERKIKKRVNAEADAFVDTFFGCIEEDLSED